MQFNGLTLVFTCIVVKKKKWLFVYTINKKEKKEKMRANGHRLTTAAQSSRSSFATDMGCSWWHDGGDTLRGEAVGADPGRALLGRGGPPPSWGDDRAASTPSLMPGVVWSSSLRSNCVWFNFEALMR